MHACVLFYDLYSLIFICTHCFNTITNLFIYFEEIAGCMFKHEAAPLCKKSNKCKVLKCQFSHTSQDKEQHSAQSDDDNELIEEDVD